MIFIGDEDNRIKNTAQAGQNRMLRNMGICLLISFLYLLLCTKSSPLYPFNDWNDANAFFTMGKGIVHGKVPYRDLFEQKGPLLYFVHALAYLISNTSFTGVFILEVLFFTAFLYYALKICMLYLRENISLLLLPVIAFAVLNMYAFRHGDSAEEICLPLLAASMYMLLKYYKAYPEPLKRSSFFAAGFIAGCVVWIKFTLIGFWVGMFLVLFVGTVVRRGAGRAFLEIAIAFAGFIASSLPWVLYFGLNNALPDFLNGYFYVNFRYYSVRMRLYERLITGLDAIFLGTQQNVVFSLLFFAGFPAFLATKKFIARRLLKLGLSVCICALFATAYWGGVSFPYYFLIFAPFCIFGFIYVGSCVSHLAKDFFTKKRLYTVIPCVTAALLALTYFTNANTYMLQWKRSDMVQYRFAGLIRETSGATLLNYGTLDNGFYTVLGIVPDVRFFEVQNIQNKKYSGLAEQRQYIEKARTDYVVIQLRQVRNPQELKIPYLYENYKLIAWQDQMFGGIVRRYCLFKAKRLP